MSLSFYSMFGWTVGLTMIALQSPATSLAAQDDPTPAPAPPAIESASDEGQLAIDQFKFSKQFKCELFAAEPEVANVVAIHRDYQGRLFACETFRQERGVEDNRNHSHWMDEELAAQTVEDRINYIRKYIPDADQSYTKFDDRIRMLVDSNDDGKADQVTVFADRFNRLEMGTGAGVLSYRDKVYYTCIPELFELQDLDNDGVADKRKSLHSGYGVRFAFRGHDLHGLIVGPDGRLYFSIGDRGYNISPTIKDPASGAVFRCELDGSNLEVIATGLRNPQELAFDDFGNLFTCDNNSDSGDRARWTEIIEGGDSGWRMYYQYHEDRGPFNREKIWHPFHADTPAYIIPPIENLSDGPSGLEYYPGTGWGDDFKNRFFLCDFRGDPSQSGVRSFRNQPDGAHWKVVDSEQPFWNMLTTDIDFGSDGRIYIADWVFGWSGVNKGRIYAFSYLNNDAAIVAEVQSLLKNGFAKTKTQRLTALISHPDQRIRQEVQFELVRRQDKLTLTSIALSPEQPQLGRVHAIWGLGQLGRASLSQNKKPDTQFLGKVLLDEDPQIATAACKIAHDIGYKKTTELRQLLKHTNLRLRFQAAMALARVGDDSDIQSIVELLVDNNDADPIVRHGGIMALSKIFTRNQTPADSAVLKLASHKSKSVRIAVCIAMRKLIQSNQTGVYQHKQFASKIVAGLLKDDNQQVTLEAARVIHDLFVNSNMADLAALISDATQPHRSDALTRRIISANARLGTRASATALANFAANTDNDLERRVDAINALSQWAAPPARDMVLQAWRPLAPNKRNLADAHDALKSVFSKLTARVDSVTDAAIAAAGKLNLGSIGPELQSVALNDAYNENTRLTALVSLASLNAPGLGDVLEQLEAEFQSGKLPPKLTGQLVKLVSKNDELRGLSLIEQVINGESQIAQQLAIASLGTMKSESSANMLIGFLKRMSNNDFPPALRLDVSLAAAERLDQSVKTQLASYTNAISQSENPSSQYRDALVGGEAALGAKIFRGKTEVSCVRCHQIAGTGGVVGPDLSDVGLKRDRNYLLDSIVDPNKAIAEGYAQIKVQTEDGELFVGIVKRETDDELVLLDADGKEIVIEQDAIEGRLTGQSSMPTDLIKHLSKKELRDLIEFLAQQKTPPKSRALIHE